MGLWRTIPARRDARLDIVPVDYVRDVIMVIRRHPESLGRCFHVTSSPEGTIAVGEMVAIVESFFPGKKPVQFRDPERWRRSVLPFLKRIPIRRLKLAAGAADAYLPYMTANSIFDDPGCREMLKSAGIAAPDVRDYVTNLVTFASVTKIGR